MSDTARLERGYRRCLRWYPADFRRDHDTEILGVLMDGARDGQTRPALTECIDLAAGALHARLGPTLPRSDRAGWAVVRLLCAGAVAELAALVVVLATAGGVRSTVAALNPGFTAAQWHAVLTGEIDPTAVAAAVAIGFWLWMAWLTSRGHGWPRPVFVLFFLLTTYSLLSGLSAGSALYARLDVAVATILWIVEAATLAVMTRVEISRHFRRQVPVSSASAG